MSIVAEAPDFLQVFSDGSVKRFAHKSVPPSENTSDKYTFHDVTIDPSKPITARIFLPSTTTDENLPVLVYFHGGGFCIGSTTWLGYHHFLGNLSGSAGAIVVSVDYRLAPEHKLPAAYDDCLSALEWLGSAEAEPWLERADLSRVFLSGDSAGGNIAHHVALRSVETNNNNNNNVKGLFSIHPFFGSEARTELEMEVGSGDDMAMNDMFWGLSLPEGSDRDFYGCNVEKGEGEIEWGSFPAVVVFVAGLDFLKERGVMYGDFLKRRGVKSVRVVEAEGEKHVFHAWDPESEATCLMQKQITCFMQSM